MYKGSPPDPGPIGGGGRFPGHPQIRGNLEEFAVSTCRHCQRSLVWYEEQIIVPSISIGPPPSDDLSADIKHDYLEAASIAAKSPRGAAALLRLCVQKLCKELGQSGDNLNSDIAELVKQGLPVELQQALDTVRVIGNNAVHPGEINLKDDPDTVVALLVLINGIVERMVTQPRKTKELYGGLPKSVRDQIQKRDARDKPDSVAD